MNPLDATMVYAVHCARDAAGAWMMMQLRQPEEQEDPDWRPYKDLPREAARLAETARGWGAPASLTDAVRHATRITPVHMFDLPDMPTLHKGRVILVGDSGHGTLPTFGQGLNQAIEDCAVLHELLGAFPDIASSTAQRATAFAVYDQVRLVRVHHIAAASRAVAARWAASSWLQMRVGRVIFRTIVAVQNTLGLNDAILAYDYLPDLQGAIEAHKKDHSSLGSEEPVVIRN
ncbi:hypothetical protein HK405_000622 [Cladochytrium tenue]|nr:hypothetical protein HK405_000622 [Cladochytrium tenue]